MNKNIGYKETASLIGVPVGTVYAWVSRGLLPHIRLGPRLVRFSEREISEWLDEKKVAAREVSSNRRTK